MTTSACRNSYLGILALSLIVPLCVLGTGCGGHLPVIEGRIPIRADGSAEIVVQDKRAAEERGDQSFVSKDLESWTAGDAHFDPPPATLVGRRLAQVFWDEISGREVLLSTFSAQISKRSRSSALAAYAGNPGGAGALVGVFGPVGLLYGAATDAVLGGLKSHTLTLECSISTVVSGSSIGVGHTEPFPDAEADVPAAMARAVEGALDKLVDLIRTIGILKRPPPAPAPPA